MAREYALTLLCLFGLFTFIVKLRKDEQEAESAVFIMALSRGPFLL